MTAPSVPPTVEKAKVVVLNDQGTETGSRVLLYNPEMLQYRRAPTFDTKNISGKEHAVDHRAGGGKATLTVKLLFDTTREMQMATDGVAVTAGTDVRQYTKFFVNLLKENTEGSSGKQPYCRFEWGGKIYIVKGFATSVDVTYNLFMPNGTPIRSEMTVAFEEQASMEELDRLWQNPTSRSEARKTWVVREGDRLDYIAYQEYKDSSRWRHIAETNGIEDPFNLRPGQILKLVPLP
jgi:nucleoid-associated protein YgaU